MGEAALLDKKQQTGQHPEVSGKHRRWWWQALELAVILPVCLLVLEGFLHWAGVGQEEFLEPDGKLGCRHIAGKKVVWRLEGYSNERLNSKGLRDVERNIAKVPGVYRIALIGDSAVEGLQVPLQDTAGSRLQEKLSALGRNVEVLNFGCSSYSNGQELLQLKQHVLQYSPDLVIVMYNRGDFIENIRDPRTLKAEPRPYFYIKDGALAQDNEVMAANTHVFKAQPALDFLRRNSCIYGILAHTNLTLNLNEPLYSKLRNSLMKKLDRRSVEREKNYKQSYPIQDVWKVTETIILQMNQTCRDNHCAFALVCFPNIVNDTAYSQQIQTLEALARSKGFRFVDLTPSYVSAENPKKLFLKYHFSAAGHELAAQKMLKLSL